MQCLEQPKNMESSWPCRPLSQVWQYTLLCVCVGSHTCYMWAVPSHTPLDVLQLTAPPLGSCQARPSLPSDTSGMSVTLSCQHSFSMLNCCCHWTCGCCQQRFTDHWGALLHMVHLLYSWVLACCENINSVNRLHNCSWWCGLAMTYYFEYDILLYIRWMPLHLWMQLWILVWVCERLDTHYYNMD